MVLCVIGVLVFICSDIMLVRWCSGVLLGCRWVVLLF